MQSPLFLVISTKPEAEEKSLCQRILDPVPCFRVPRDFSSGAMLKLVPSEPLRGDEGASQVPSFEMTKLCALVYEPILAQVHPSRIRLFK